MTDPSLAVLVLLGLAALAAGFVDSVVGGGGLIQLPALLVGLPQAAPVQVLATSKVGSISGTSISSVTYYRRVRPDPRVFVPMMALAFAGAFAGAVVASHLSRGVFEPIVLVALVLVGAWVLLNPTLGAQTLLRHPGRRHAAIAMGVGVVIGCYDGAIGPGTGSFFVIALVGLLGYDFLQASAKARLANWATNLGALVLFVPGGHVLWPTAIVIGVCNLTGGYLGARTAVARGSRFVRVFFVLVVLAFIVKIGGDVLGVW